jgi:diaminopimelate decarboxylase
VIAAELRSAVAAAAREAGYPGKWPDAGLRDGAVPGRYTSSLPLRLASPAAREPAAIAGAMAASLGTREWISDVAITGGGFLTVTVTADALAGLAVRIAEAGPGCACSDALHGTRVTAPPAAGLTAASGWAEAKKLVAAQVTARLAAAAGATVALHHYSERASPRADIPRAPDVPGDRTPLVAQAVAFAGADAIAYALARTPPERAGAPDPVACARHVAGNPAYAVRYAHSCAASTLRWAAALGLSRGEAATFRPGSLAHPRERALLAALSWLPERVAQAARRGRPHEFTAYLEDLAETYQACREACPAWPERGTGGARGTGLPGDARTVRARLWLTGAAATGLASGLGLLGVSAPCRLLSDDNWIPRGDSPDHEGNSMSRVAHPAGPRHADVLPADHPPAPPADLNALAAAVWPRSARREDGVLTVGGVDVRELAETYGTPLFVCDEADLRSRCADYREAFGSDAGVFYAAKAFCSRAVLRWVSDEGLGVDVCTGGELEVALSAGVRPEMITLHGNNKSLAELTRAAAAGVGHIVIDSFEEIARLAYIAERGRPGMAPRRPRVLVRVTTGVEAHTHEFMATAHDDQKFGFSLASGAADEAVRRVVACPDLELAGLHSHIGSQIFDTAGFEVAAHRVLELAVRIRDEHGLEISELDLGGGFGIAYTEDDSAPEVKLLAQSIGDIVDRQCRAAGLSRPRLTVEPGRAIVGPGTVTIYEVGTIKDVDGLRTYVSVDGGMSDNIRTALYDAAYTCALASRASDAPPMLSRVVGKHCESGDIVVRHAYLPADLAPGDLVAVAATGAYCRSLASNYNHVPRPAVVAVRDGTARLAVRRESLDDLLRLDVG